MSAFAIRFDFMTAVAKRCGILITAQNDFGDFHQGTAVSFQIFISKFVFSMLGSFLSRRLRRARPCQLRTRGSFKAAASAAP